MASLLPADATIAVLGAGGGAQLAPLLSRDPRIIFAVDIVPSVFPVMRAMGIAGLNDQRVVPVVKDGRTFLQQHAGLYDLVYMPSTHSAFRPVQNFFEPADRLHTLEAFQLYRTRLKPDGVLVIKEAYREKWEPLLQTYLRTLRAAQFFVTSRRVGDHVVLFAVTDPQKLEEIHHLFAQDESLPEDLNQGAERGLIANDDRPYPANRTFTPKLLWLVSGLLLVTVVGASLVVWRVSGGLNGLAPLLCGSNYTALLLAMQLLGTSWLANPLDAPLVGTLTFLIAAGLGALGYERPRFLWLLTLSGVLGMVVGGPKAIIGVGILSVWSGGLFPILLHRYRHHLATLLVLDGVGAVTGGALYLWGPMVVGIRQFLIIMAGLFFVTSWLVRRAPHTGRAAAPSWPIPGVSR